MSPPPPVAGLPEDAQNERLITVANDALINFGLSDDADLKLHRLGENAVFQVRRRSDSSLYALRIHRRQYRSDAEISSELAWLQALHETGELVPVGNPGIDGRLLQLVSSGPPEPAERYQCDLLTWIDGIPLRKAEPGVALPLLGALVARLHRHAEGWEPPSWFDRPSFDEHGLIGSAAVIGDYRNVEVAPEDRSLFDEAAGSIRREVTSLSKHPSTFGLIHGDFLDNNLLFAGSAAGLVDFDDAGWGWYMYDLGTVRYRGKALVDEESWLELFLSGYAEHRQFPVGELELLPVFLAVRALAMVGWLHTHGAYGEKWRQAIVDDARLRCASLLGLTGGQRQ